MTRSEQAQFVKDMMETIEVNVLHMIKAERIPANWDGVELRQYLAHKFVNNVGTMTNARRRNYRNAILVNNL